MATDRARQGRFAEYERERDTILTGSASVESNLCGTLAADEEHAADGSSSSKGGMEEAEADYRLSRCVLPI